MKFKENKLNERLIAYCPECESIDEAKAIRFSFKLDGIKERICKQCKAVLDLEEK